MRFNVSVQGNFYKSITAANTGAALSLVSADIANGLVPNYDASLPQNVVISIDPFSQWENVAPQNPNRFDVWVAPDASEWIYVYDVPRGPDGQYVTDDPNTAENEAALRWVPHVQVNEQ